MNKVNEVVDVTELSEDIEVIGPGQILAQGRSALGLSQQDVADKLNFRLPLVVNIENEIFDTSLPATYNRGYLRSYAKLVAVSAEDVIASYEMLDIAKKQCAEMQSFSKITTKQAEHSRLMWLTYFILAAIIASTLVWFFQDNKAASNVAALISSNASETASENMTEPDIANSNIPSTTQLEKLNDTVITKRNDVNKNINEQTLAIDNNQSLLSSRDSLDEIAPAVNTTPAVTTGDSATTVIEQAETTVLASNKVPVSFVFSGDCWVNIYDATGERIAWGVKKADYVMNIKGVSPFSITLGKPELVAITYHGKNIDMSQFSRGNIAQFTLPLATN